MATPKDSELRFLTDAGLLIPEKLDVSEVDVLLDLTSAGNREIGRQHSMWAVFHSYALHVLAKLETILAEKERAHRISLARFRDKNSRKYPTKWKLDDAALLNPRLAAEADEIQTLQSQAKHVESIVESYAGFRHAASREISRRGQEQAPRD